MVSDLELLFLAYLDMATIFQCEYLVVVQVVRVIVRQLLVLLVVATIYLVQLKL